MRQMGTARQDADHDLGLTGTLNRRSDWISDLSECTVAAHLG
jgi:hypothetical protein